MGSHHEVVQVVFVVQAADHLVLALVLMLLALGMVLWRCSVLEQATGSFHIVVAVCCHGAREILDRLTIPVLIKVDRLGGRPETLILLVQHHTRCLNHNLTVFHATMLLLMVLLLTKVRMALTSAQKRLLILMTILLFLLLQDVAIILPALLKQDVVQLSLDGRLLLARGAAELGRDDPCSRPRTTHNLPIFVDIVIDIGGILVDLGSGVEHGHLAGSVD